MSDVEINVGANYERLLQNSRTAIQELLREFRNMEAAALRGASARSLTGEGGPADRLYAQQPAVRELRDMSRFIAAQAELQRRNLPNVFGRAAERAGLDRQAGLRFGIAEEREFRRRDRAQNDLDRTLFAAGDQARRIVRSLGVDPESDLGLRTIKDVLRRERESREEIIDLNQRIANEGERQQQALESAQRRLRDALQSRAEREAAAATRVPGRQGGLLGLEADERALTEQARAQARVADIEARRRLGVTDSLAQAETAHRVEAQSIRRDVAVRLQRNREYIAAQAETIAAERRMRAAINQQAQGLLRADPGQFGGGTRFQRFQASIAGRTGGAPRLPTEFLGFGQFLQARFLTTAGFALSGGAIYLAQQQIREMIREASQLQVQFRVIQGTLESTGQTGEEAFRRVRAGVLETARATNTIASEVANVQRQLAGAFAGEDLVPDFARARIESEAGLRLARVAGLPTQEITDSLTAVTRSFDLPEGAFERLGDLIVGLENRFGVLAPEIIRFTADLAPLGSELGFTAEQLATLGAAAQQVSGQSGAVLAEQIGRILPGLQQRATDVINLFRNLPSGEDLARAFGANDIARVFEILLRDYDLLNRAQQNQLAALVGGRREAGSFFALLESGDAVLRSLAGGSDQFAGSLDRRFAAASESVTFAFERLERSVEQLGNALFEAGLGDALSGIADAGAVVVDIVGVVADVFGFLNDSTDGMAARLIGIAVALRAVAAASAALAGRGAVGAAGAAGAGRTGFSAAAGVGSLQNILIAQTLTGVSIPAGPSSAFASPLATDAAAAAAVGARRGAISNAARSAGSRLATGVRAGLQRALVPLLVGETVSGLVNELNVGGAGSAADAGLAGAARGAGLGFAVGGPWGALIGGGLGAAIGIGQNIGRAPAARPDAGIIDIASGAETRQQFLDLYRTSLERVAEEDERIRALLAFIDQFGLTDGAYRALRAAVRDARENADNALGEQARGIREELSVRREAAEAEALSARIQQQVATESRTVDQAVRAFQSGRASQRDVLAAMDGQILAIQQQIEGALSAPGGPLDTAGLEAQLDQAVAARNEFIVGVINSRFETLGRVGEIFGGTQGSLDTQLAQARGRLSALRAVGAEDEDLQQAAFLILEIQRQMLQDEIDKTEGLANQIAIAQRGIVADVGARQVVVSGLVEQALDSIDFRQLVQDLFLPLEQIPARTTINLPFVPDIEIADRFGEVARAALGEDQFEQAVEELVESLVETGEAESRVIEEGIKLINHRIRRLQEALGRIAREYGKDSPKARQLAELISHLRTQRVQIERTLGDLADVTTQTIEGDVGGGDSGGDDLPRRLAEARIAIERARANGDPVRLAQLAIESARIQQQFAKDEAERLQGVAAEIEARNQLQRAEQERINAFLELGSALTQDPVLQASYELAQAQNAVAAAAGDAERFRALAQQVSAERAYRDAIRDVMRSRTELLMAIASAAGDEVAVAEGALDLARQALERALAEGAGEAAVNDAQRGIVEAQARLRDARVNAQTDDINFALEMGRITARQAIAQLQGLLQLVVGNEEATEDILLRIKQLRDQAGQDLATNLPAEFNIEGLIYQARRLNEARGAGLNYQAPQVLTNDYRTYEINLIGNDPAAMSAALDTIVAAVNAPPRTGTYPSLY